MARIGLMPLGRPTFDVPYAEDMTARAITALEAAGHQIIGSRGLLFDASAANAALADLAHETMDLLLLLQVTFTDASMTVTIAEQSRAPLAIWAFPEPRSGGRLRLNAFCGLNLAAHALGRAGHSFRWAYAAPDAAHMPDVFDALFGQAERDVFYPMGAKPTVFEEHAAMTALAKLRGTKIGLIGEHPIGFDTCRYDAFALDRLIGASVEKIELPQFLDRARAVPEAQVALAKAQSSLRITGLDEVDQPQLDRSMSVLRALEGVVADGGYQALAVRCWPEMFTDYGCAACGPMGLMSEAGVPCACEADVMGALTSLMMQQVAGAPSFLADVVDMDEASNTGVLWHCGLAPLSMADETTPPMAQIHSNRRMPLLQEFALKPGRVTVARLTQAKNIQALVLAGAEMITAPKGQPAKSYTGTSGVIRFDRPVADVTSVMMEMGLEHHVSIVYGEHRGTLRAIAAQLGLPVIELA